jgi:hypothetical protein
MMGRADFFAEGDWNVACFRCGRKRKASTMRKQWQGYYVCPEHREPRHPQDFVKAKAESTTVPWSQEMPAEVFTMLCDPNGMTALPNKAIPGCVMPGYISPSFYPSAL